MAKIELPISNGFAVSKSKPWTNQDLVNWYLSLPENGALSQASLFQTEGIKELLETASDEINRGSIVMNEIPYFVNGTKLYSITRTIDPASGAETFTANDLGTIAGDERVSMATNGTQICIVIPGGTGYVYDSSGPTLSTISDATFTTDVGPSNSVNYIDGFFVHTSSKSGNESVFFHSNLNDATTYTATDFGSAEVDPDKINTGHVHNNKFYALGEKTIEVFDNVGGSGFVFQRREGLIIPKGIKANFSVTEFDGGFVFIGAGVNEQPAIWKVTGSNLSRLSTTEIQDELASFNDTELSDAFSWVSGEGGAYFVHFTISNKTYSFDATASQLSGRKIWHRRSSFINEAQTRNRVQSAVTAYGRVMVGDFATGKIGELDIDTYTEYDQIMFRECKTASLRELDKSLSVESVELGIESGVGNSDITDPQIELRMSFDGGREWSNWRNRSMGKIGEYYRRCIWNQCGRLDNQGQLHIRTSEKCKATITSLSVEVS